MYKNDKEWPEKRCEDLARRIYEFLLKNEMWIDVSIYYNGKVMTSCGEINGEWKFAYNGDPFLIDNKDPRDYFEYVNPDHILSMSFEGIFYECMNGYAGDYGWCVVQEFDDLLAEYGLYYELGNAWNLTLYKE